MIILPKPHNDSVQEFYNIIAGFDFSTEDLSEANKKLIAISQYPIDTLKVPRVGVDPAANRYAEQLYQDILNGEEEYPDLFLADILTGYFNSMEWWEYPEPKFRNCIKDIPKETFLERIKYFPVFNLINSFPAITPYNLLHEGSPSGSGYEIFGFDTDWLLQSVQSLDAKSAEAEILDFKLKRFYYTPDELLALSNSFSDLLIPELKKRFVNTTLNPVSFRFQKITFNNAAQTILYFIHWSRYWSQNGHGVITYMKQPLFQLTPELESGKK